MSDYFLKKFKNYKVYVVAASLMLGIVFSFKITDNYFEISKNIEIFAGVFREINTYYVDGIDAGKLTKKAIDEMLNTLDPYTNFISESEAEDFRFQITGQYGGIGSQISQKGDYVVITDPYQGYPAQKEDIRAGDLIVEIEGKSAKNKNTSEISKLLKGQPGTKVKLTISRNNGEIVKHVTREEIKVKNVPFFGMVDSETGYIKLAGFTNDAGKEVHLALQELKNQNVRNVILDVRGNPGGLLHEAVNVVNVFVPIGVDIVSTKGKVKEWDKVYKTINQPVDIDINLVVLTNRSSASASEIVSGSIQDLDRGVIIGQKTFGKGLVQSTRPLSYNTQIKITTAKYYTPSGRCIQALDYKNRNEDGSVGHVVDSLKKHFPTKGGRMVFEGGGVDPEIVTELSNYSPMVVSLLSKMLIFDFATSYRLNNEKIAAAKDFKLSDRDFEDFKKFISTKDYDYSTQTEKELEELKKKAESENYFDAIKTTYESLKEKLKHDKLSDVEKNKQQIVDLLEEEIVKRYYFQNGQIEVGFKHDTEIKAALKLFAEPGKYETILNANAKR